MTPIPMLTLWQVSHFYGKSGDKFANSVGTPEAVEILPPDERQRWERLAQNALNTEEFRNWVPYAVQVFDRLQERLTDPTLQRWEAYSILRDFCQRAEDEFKSTHFYVQLEPALKSYYLRSSDGWEAVLTAFPYLGQEIHEASLCLALERGTACVFHLMRIMEVGLQAAKSAAKVRTKSPTWEAVLGAIDKKLKPKSGVRKSPLARKRTAYLAEIAMLMRAAKDAWRNPTMHDYRRAYTTTQAMDIFRAVRELMTKMAKGE